MSNNTPATQLDQTPPSLSSRLDKWTNCVQHRPDLPAYRAVIRDYGRGNVEATVTIAKRFRQMSATHPPVTQTRKTAEALAENGRRALARARTTIRRSVMAAGLDHLLTLTYRQNQKDTCRVWRHFSRFIRLVRKKTVKPFPFVAVQELQERGAIHIHAAVQGYQDVRVLRRLWHEVIGGAKEGNIDVQYFGQDHSRLAKYLAKYISKDLVSAADGTHRYKRSRGIREPNELLLLPATAALDDVLINEFLARGAEIKFHENRLNAEGPKWFWACSW